MSFDLERERAVQTLCSHFAQDHLTTQELERRFEQAYRATSLDELRALTVGLPVLAGTPLPEAPPMYAVAAPAAAPEEKRYLALMSEVRKQGLWSATSRIKASAWMGAVRLDLRDAVVPEGGVDIDASAVMGEVLIILPPGMRADVDGFAIMGEFSDRTRGADARGATPAIRVSGSAIMGSVRVETRLPNEGMLEAWRRRLRGG